MENQQASDTMTESQSTCVTNKGPLHSIMKHPHQAPSPQDAAAGLNLLQQTLTSSHPVIHTVYRVDKNNLPRGDTAPVQPPYVSGWPTFNAVPPSLIQSQNKAVQRSPKVLQSNGRPVENCSIGQASAHYIISNAPPAVLHQESGFDAILQPGVRPKTYPYMHSGRVEVSAKPQHSLKRPRFASKPVYSVYPPTEWHKQQRAAQEINMYPTARGSTTSVWMSPQSRILSLSDAMQEDIDKHQQNLINQSLPSNFHSCAIIRNSLGSVVPSMDLLPCITYIPPKCPKTLTEAACMYIDYLIQENENLVHISYCEFHQPFTPEKQREFIAEATKGPSQMPSDKFRGWLKQFNVDVEVVTGEMQPSEEAEEDLEDFDASLFLPDIHREPQSKESPQQAANLAQFIPGLMSEKLTEGRVIIQCLPGDLPRSFGQHTEQRDSTDDEADITSPVQQDVDSENSQSPPHNNELSKSLGSPLADGSNIHQ